MHSHNFLWKFLSSIVDAVRKTTSAVLFVSESTIKLDIKKYVCCSLHTYSIYCVTLFALGTEEDFKKHEKNLQCLRAGFNRGPAEYVPVT
jgi:hypothetical protein